MFCLSDGVSVNSLDNTHPLQLETAIDMPGSLDCLRAVAAETKTTTVYTGVAAGTSHGACLTLNDHNRLRLFIQEFTFRGLLPHIEKNIRQLNDQVDTHTHTQDDHETSQLPRFTTVLSCIVIFLVTVA